MLDPKDEGVLIKSVSMCVGGCDLVWCVQAWEQYADCVKATPPANLKVSVYKCESVCVWCVPTVWAWGCVDDS